MAANSRISVCGVSVKIECERGVVARNDRGTACRVSTGRAGAAKMTIRGTFAGHTTPLHARLRDDEALQWTVMRNLQVHA
jgi:hypothetical protein